MFEIQEFEFKKLPHWAQVILRVREHHPPKSVFQIQVDELSIFPEGITFNGRPVIDIPE